MSFLQISNSSVVRLALPILLESLTAQLLVKPFSLPLGRILNKNDLFLRKIDSQDNFDVQIRQIT